VARVAGRLAIGPLSVGQWRDPYGPLNRAIDDLAWLHPRPTRCWPSEARS